MLSCTVKRKINKVKRLFKTKLAAVLQVTDQSKAGAAVTSTAIPHNQHD